MSMSSYTVLLVDDDTGILNFLKIKLKTCGYDCITALSGSEALEKIHLRSPDMIVLDLIMPGMSGLSMLKELRTFSKVPVIILSAKGSDTDKIEGLKLGADDYLSKPFSPGELIARIEALRRRVEVAGNKPFLESFSVGGINIDFVHHKVLVNGTDKYLTRIEWLLLSHLVQNAGRLISYEELLRKIWGPEYLDDIQILKVWISRLRHKLEENTNETKIIRTIPKAGYIMSTSEMLNGAKAAEPGAVKS
jgi:two-component system, OmpR family, KDP operon response regulator KdpE